MGRLLGRFNRWFDRQSVRYRHVVDWALRHRAWTFGLVVLCMVNVASGVYSPFLYFRF